MSKCRRKRPKPKQLSWPRFKLTLRWRFSKSRALSVPDIIVD
jgi:hypothetical protein